MYWLKTVHHDVVVQIHKEDLSIIVYYQYQLDCNNKAPGAIISRYLDN